LETGIDAVTREGQDGKPVDSIFLTEVVGNGQRRTRATIRVDSKDFKELVKVMFAADRKAAIKAFAQVLNATA
jgi:ferritin-like protein